ncbi:MAG TPA: ABC transporter ATP-binding protein [Polyangiaceae bacterium]|nr:ABC transporter ATP-binding protein [Polyangiaceae bacterium]
MPPAVSLRSVTKRYVEGSAERVVLRGVDMAVEPGEMVVLLGKSGSGKTTLLNLMSGIDLPSSGEVTVLGQNLAVLSEEERTLFRRHNVGFIFQAYNLVSTLSVEENVLLPLELGGKLDARARQGALELLAEVGLGGRAESFPDTLSGGEQQRVAVVRAIVHRPLLVLADEPTGNLDDETGREVLDLIHRLTRERRSTVLIVTHDRDLIERADRIFVLERGELARRAKSEVRPASAP